MCSRRDFETTSDVSMPHVSVFHESLDVLNRNELSAATGNIRSITHE